MKLIVIDTETGGLDSYEHSLLTLGATVWPPDPRITFAYSVRENPYRMTPGALAVNKIDLVEHDKVALEPGAVWSAFLGFCAAQEGALRVAGRYVLGGHNTPFDIGYLKRLHHLSGDATAFGDIFSHRFVDTMAIGTFLLLAGKVPPRQGMGLTALLTLFELPHPEAHTALGDALATAALLDKMLKVLA